MSRKVNLTKAVIEASELPPRGKRLVLMDAKTSGLQCRITHSGVKTFSVFRRVKSGLPERVTLGKYPDMSIEQARTEAAKINATIAVGGSPALVKRAHKNEFTFKELFDEYLERHSKIRKGTWKRDDANYHLYLDKSLGKKRLSEITRSHIGTIHSSITKQLRKSNKNKEQIINKSGTTANRILALVSSIFGWGITAGLCDINPARGIKKISEQSRDRFLQTEELPKFFSSLMMESNVTIRDFILIALLTGARRSNVLSMRWDQISFDRKEWRIPKTKNGEPQSIPLTDEALQILQERKSNCSEFVFQGGGKKGHITELRRGWDRILARAGIHDLRIHDLRRTLGSWQAKTGASLIIVGKSLGHKSAASTAVYARLDLDPVRKSIETATDAIFKAAGLKSR